MRAVVTAIDREAKQVELEGGERIGYGTLLLGTGSEPRRLEGPEDERVIHFRSFADYRTLRHLLTDGSRAVVVGGGYIGAEIAASRSQNGAHVTHVFPDDVLGASQFPPSLAAVPEAVHRPRRRAAAGRAPKSPCRTMRTSASPSMTAPPSAATSS